MKETNNKSNSVKNERKVFLNTKKQKQEEAPAVVVEKPSLSKPEKVTSRSNYWNHISKL